MYNKISFKNGELEFEKTLEEIMKASNTRLAIIPVANLTKGTFSLKSLQCNFHFLQDCVAYARLLECAYFTGSIKAMTSECQTLERKQLEDGNLSEEQAKKLKHLLETIDIFNDIIKQVYTKEQVAFSSADKMVKFMATYFSKDTSCFSNFNGFNTFLNNLDENKPNNVLKPLLQKVLQISHFFGLWKW